MPEKNKTLHILIALMVISSIIIYLNSKRVTKTLEISERTLEMSREMIAISKEMLKKLGHPFTEDDLELGLIYKATFKAYDRSCKRWICRLEKKGVEKDSKLFALKKEPPNVPFIIEKHDENFEFRPVAFTNP